MKLFVSLLGTYARRISPSMSSEIRSFYGSLKRHFQGWKESIKFDSLPVLKSLGGWNLQIPHFWHLASREEAAGDYQHFRILRGCSAGRLNSLGGWQDHDLNIKFHELSICVFLKELPTEAWHPQQNLYFQNKLVGANQSGKFSAKV
jgi:hypothetical protein